MPTKECMHGVDMNTHCAKCGPDSLPRAAPDHYENGGEDFLDRLFRTGTPVEILGAMRFTIGKYADRLGKKDDQVKELDKIINYATRYKNHLLGNK